MRFLLPEMYPKDGPYFSHTHLTENAFSGILSVSQGRRAEKPAFFRLFCIYGEDNLWQPYEPEASGGGKRHEPDQKAAQHPGG